MFKPNNVYHNLFLRTKRQVGSDFIYYQKLQTALCVTLVVKYQIVFVFVLFFLKIVFTFWSERTVQTLMKCRIIRHFILVFTVYKITYLGV